MTVQPLPPTEHQLLAEAAEFQKDGHLDMALARSDQVLARNPDSALAHDARGQALAALDRIDEARESYERVLALQPTFHATRGRLAHLLEKAGDIDAALQEWDRVARQTRAQGSLKQTITALNEAGRVLTRVLHDFPTAETVARQILRIDPDYTAAAQDLINLRQRQCAWPVIAPFDHVTREHLLGGISSISACSLTDDPLFQLAVNAARSAPAVAGASAPRAEPAERLRIGYLSSDLRVHAVGLLMYEVPSLHDRSRFEVFLYYSGPKAQPDDKVHAHYRTQGDHFIDISDLDDAAAAKRITEDGIHILVDLNGHTLHTRDDMLALRPAPVVVNWLGFPGTMGGSNHHYILADDWIVPPQYEQYYSERVMRLACYMPSNRGQEVSEAVPTRAEAGLPEDAFVLCCFNDARKVTRRTFDRWLAILQRVPRAVLWLRAAPPAAVQHLKTYAGSKNINPARIIFADVKPTVPDHLARYPLADLALDTAPYGAHTTCLDALWMGVPVLTFSGRSFASRVCGSLVRSAGLPELVCTDADAFVDLAVALARDPERLAGYRERLKASRDTCVLFDTPGLVRRLEALYATMWDEALAGRLPTPGFENLDAYMKVGSAHNHETVEVQTIEDYEGFWRDALARAGVTEPLKRIDRR